jgi:hypothetical protein
MKKIHPATAKKIKGLAAPKSPIKGRGFKRVDFNFSLANPLIKELWSIIPSAHKTEVGHRRTGGYFGFTKAISPEAAAACEKVLDYVESAAAEKRRLADEANQLKLEKAAVARDAVFQKALAEADGDVVKSWVALGCAHPAPEEIVKLKTSTGLSWGKFERRCKRNDLQSPENKIIQ